MKIVLAGVETNNKGAELMFYAILQEIERQYPDATVYIEPNSVPQGFGYLKTPICLKEKPISKVVEICRKIHVYGLARLLHLPTFFLEDIYPIKGADYYLDGSGFHFSDQWDYPSSYIDRKRRLWHSTTKEGTKIIFLPQAFGPFEKKSSRKYLGYMSDYACMIMPREKVSFEFLRTSGVVDMNKVVLYPDFTSLVEGVIPSQHAHLTNSVCIIPNYNMIKSGAIPLDDYILLFTTIISFVQAKGIGVYLLNHEGIKDEELAYKCREKMNNLVEVVTGLNAIEIKGLISSSFLVISSRFHGVVSALNSGVPCLATSWSHKYEELYKDYDINNGVLPINDISKCIEKISFLLEKKHNDEMRYHLARQQDRVKQKTVDMWKMIWSLRQFES